MMRLLKGGALCIRSESGRINELNVFPVPDGDTGTNMTRTVESAISEAAKVEGGTVGEISDALAKGALFGARGNSGVILSQFIAGACASLSGKETVSALDLAASAREGVLRAYRAIAKPVEGTMLTVFRECEECLSSVINSETSIEEALRICVEQAQKTVEKTKELLPVLKEADVVDSGGAGSLCIALGMYKTLIGEPIGDGQVKFEPDGQSGINYDLFTSESTLEWGYCTECLVRLMKAKCNPTEFDRDEAVGKLQSLGCESIVLLADGDILKVHAHTFKPSDVLDVCQEYGEFLNVKIENMSLGHTDGTEEKKKPHKRYALVAVATGEGMRALFSELSVDVTVDGGQTDNPSAEDFIAAYRSVDADHIFVLPNNSNITLAARQSAELYGGGRVTVIPTKTVAEGYSAISVFNPGSECPEDIEKDMRAAAGGVVSVEIARAIRDVTIGGVEVRCGEYIGVSSGKLVASCESEIDAACDTVSKIPDLDEREIITVFVGEGVSDERRVALTNALADRFPELEIDVYITGQRVYEYILAVE